MAVKTIRRRQGTYVSFACDRPDEFLATLVGGVAAPQGGQLIFRGQGDGTAALLPSLLRGCRWKGFEVDQAGRDIQLRVCKAEFEIYRRFSDRVQAEGLPFPWEGRAHVLGTLYREALETARLERSAQKRAELLSLVPPKETRGLFALAQHHGVPTRFLDWTEIPSVAAYFAAIGAAMAVKREAVLPRAKPPRGYLAVFVLNEDLLGLFQHEWATAFPTECPLHIVRVPRFLSPNLAAQRGVFSFDSGSFAPQHELATRVAELATALGGRSSRLPILSEITLPAAQAPELLEVLSGFGTSGASVFPGYDGLVRALDEERYWEHQSEYGRWDAARNDRPWTFASNMKRHEAVARWAVGQVGEGGDGG